MPRLRRRLCPWLLGVAAEMRAGAAFAHSALALADVKDDAHGSAAR